MLLRSSSTPVLGSLLPSFSESPNHHHNHNHNHHFDPHTTPKHPTVTNHYNHNKLSFHQTGSLNFATFSCNSSPISPAIAEFPEASLTPRNSFQRTRSEGNLEGLANAASCNYDEFSIANPHKKFSRRPPHCSMLQSIPSFSFHNSKSRFEDEEYCDEEEEFEENGDLFENSNTAEESIMGITNRESHLQEKNIAFNQEMVFLNEYHQSFEEDMDRIGREMYLATGLGVNVANGGFGGGNGGRGSGDFIPVAFGRDGRDANALEEHYKRMVEENPGNALCLRNYGHFLYQLKRDLPRAEEYYSRAILADPKDGEVLSQYAKLVWELHRDQDRASGYFERAIQAAPEDSHVQAAYATFLWETEEDADEDSSQSDHNVMPQRFHMEAMASQTA